MDKYKIDSHKLNYHLDRTADWLKGKKIYPVYMEVSPSGACNHRCNYCGLDFMKYQNRFLNTNTFKRRLSELGKLGLKSIMYAGEGEPLLHKDIASIITHTKKSGIDVGITTNGTKLNRELAQKILPRVEWIKVSINGATKKTYTKIHRCKPDNFDQVITNMANAARIRAAKKIKCTLGMQLVLLPENAEDVVLLAKIARNIGMDYLVVKPYSQHPQSITHKYSSIKYSNFETLRDEVMRYNSPSFQVVFRLNTMKKWDEAQRNYKRCLALPFWSYIDSGGNVWGCSIYLEDKRFYYGNIYENAFKEIWLGAKRAKSIKWVESKLDVCKCRVNCRMDEINRYLWELKHPPEHVNFI